MASRWSSTSTSSAAGPSPPVTPAAAGKYAAAQFTDVGHQLTYVQRQAGFVCRVDGAPADDPCVQHPAGRRLLVAVVVRRQVRHVDLLLDRRRLAQGPRRRVRRAVLAERRRQGDTAGDADRTRHCTASPSSPTSSPTPTAVVDARPGHATVRADRRPRPPRPPRRRPPPPSSGPPTARPTRRSRSPGHHHAQHAPAGASPSASRSDVPAGARGGPAARHLGAPARTPACPGWVAPAPGRCAVRRGGRRGLRTPEARRRRLMRAPPRGRPPATRPAPGRLVAVGLRAGRRRLVHHQPVAAADADRRRLPGGVGAPQRAAVGRLVPALPLAGPGDRGDPGGLPDPRGRRRRRPRAAHPADDPVAALDARAPAARLGHPGVAALRPVRRAPARHHRDLRRRRQRAGQPQAAAPLGAAGALRDRQRARRRDHHAAAPGRQPSGGSGPRRPCAAATAAGSAGSGGCSCPCSRTRWSARSRWPPAWTPAATAARPAPPRANVVPPAG